MQHFFFHLYKQVYTELPLLTKWLAEGIVVALVALEP